MALALYNKKRNFKKTAEPKGKEKKSKTKLTFVVQLHDASHLHYDFRLEMQGVLKSWAVPKGPSLNPEIKRLAMMVEDHPYDYKDFEGNIPKGNYGAGTVIVWDNGTYHAANAEEGETGEKALLAGLKKGHISFILEGKKLKGEFALVKLHGRQENAWLLIKKKDKYASAADVLKKNKSVISEHTLMQMEKLSADPKPEKIKKSALTKNHISEKIKILTSPKTKPLERITPMKAEIGDKVFDSADWVFEIKHDGYRALANIENGKVDLYSRNFLSFNQVYAPIVKELSRIEHTVILDGEVVVENEKGRSGFQLLQNYENTGSGELKYYVFDLLHLNDYSLVDLPLINRKELLKTLLAKAKLKNVFYSDHIEKQGVDFLNAAVKNNLEGIIAKDIHSPYRVGRRSKEWLKIKIQHQQEAVIAGITEPHGSRKHFGSLVLVVAENGGWKYIGNCGTGFSDKTLVELYDTFKPLFTSVKPFKEKINSYGKVQWLTPKIVCEIKFTEWTGDGHMRHPVFLGLRKDKSPFEIKRELTPGEMKNEKIKAESKSKGNELNGGIEKDYDLNVGNITLRLTNQNKIYWAKEGYTKRDLISYYDSISDLILPYLKDRPESMNRFPNGIEGENFYQKDVDIAKSPSWLKTEKIYSESNSKFIDYLVCNDKATLLYMANLGCIELHPWNSRIPNINNADWSVIDLDPHEISFKEVVKAALSVKETLDQLEIESYCKTSGASGLHIYIPLGGKYDYDTAKNFAELIAHLVNEKLPSTTSIIRTPSKRRKKVYLDFLQNRRGQTLAAPYSVRPRPGATVSTPLLWSEVNEKLDPTKFTMLNLLNRVNKKGDLWKPVLGKGENISKALKNLEEPA
ncbi:MAG: DNA ligase D [Bacteroidetes bacterium]|nr:DNA ligase D [Bacteroidota bacterium]